MPSIIGIDCGLGGAIAFIEPHGASVCPTPTITVRKGKGKRREYDEQAMRDLIDECGKDDQYVAYIEHVMPRPKEGVSSSHKSGLGNGLWRGLLVAFEIPYTVVFPTRWQREMFRCVDKIDTKSASLLVAKRLFPKVSLRPTEKCKKDSHGMSDALLIAEYGRRMTDGNGAA